MAYLYEFLYRGNADPSKAAWHVVMAEDTTGLDGQAVTTYDGPLSIAQAQAKGYALPDMLAVVNTGVAATVDAANAQISSLAAQLTTSTGQVTQLQAQIAQLQAQIAAS